LPHSFDLGFSSMVSPVTAAMQATHAATRLVRGEAVTYNNGTENVSIDWAVRGFTSWDRTAPFNGVRVADRSTDWLIAAADLVNAAGSLIEPARTHEITDADGRVFRVMPFGQDKQLWQWHDRARTTYRIHTKERE